jgi:Protein of unknown function (DUF1697)
MVSRSHILSGKSWCPRFESGSRHRRNVCLVLPVIRRFGLEPGACAADPRSSRYEERDPSERSRATATSTLRRVSPVRYVALLRGINVGGRTLVKMADLKNCFENLGFDEVSTYIASGNVLFESDEGATADLATTIEGAIEQRFELPVKVVVLDHKGYARIVKAIPKPWISDGMLRAKRRVPAPRHRREAGGARAGPRRRDRGGQAGRWGDPVGDAAGLAQPERDAQAHWRRRLQGPDRP